MKNLSMKISVAAIACAMLASCGGGSSDSAVVVSTASVQGPTFGDCLQLSPGVEFIKSNSYKGLIVQETFEGQQAIGAVELHPDDTRFGAIYQTISDGYMHLLGAIDYSQGGTFSSKDVYSAEAKLPINMVPGQTAQLNYTDTITSVMSGNSTATLSEQLTFLGFEDLTLGGHSFANTCKIKEPSNVAGQFWVSWLAKGFGVIKTETQDAQGVAVPGSTVELKTIVVAP